MTHRAPTWIENTDGYDSFQWLSDVHGIDTTGAVGVILFGNEDSPTRAEVYAVDRYDVPPIRVYDYDEDADKLVLSDKAEAS